jgi:ABC-type Fe3+ transport system substrate-binding protein
MKTITAIALALASLGSAAHDAMAQSAEADYATKNLGVSADLVKQACAEGSLMFYSLIIGGEESRPAQKFGEHFPCIKINVFSASGGAIGERFMTEFRAKNAQADVMMNSSPAFGTEMISNKMLAQYTPPNADKVAPQWKEEGYWYGVGVVYIGIGYNTEEITAADKTWIDGVKTWKQVLDNPFAGRMAMVDIRAGGSTHLPYYYFKHELGADSWKKLADEKPTIFNGINPLGDQLAAGEFAFVPHATLDTAVNERRERGAPIAWKFPEPGLGIPYFLGIASNAPHPAASKLFMAWSLSEEGATTWVNESGMAPASSLAKDDRDVTKQDWYALPKEIYQADWKAISDEIPSMVKEFQATFSK